MRVVFVYLDFSKGAGGKFYSGLGSLSAVLKSDGHTTSLVHVMKRESLRDVVAQVVARRPDLVGFSCTTNVFPHIPPLAAEIKARLDVPIVCGGPHATLSPESVLAHDGIDFVCIGEGEAPLQELCSALANGASGRGIPGIWTKAAGAVERTPVRPLRKDLDTLPFPDRSIFDYGQLQDSRMSRHTFMASRGCPFACTYCCNASLNAISDGTVKYTRWRGVDNVLDEVEQTLRQYPARHVHFHDDLFTLDKRWLAEFADGYRRRVHVPFACNSRVGVLDENRIESLKKAGCELLMIGIESGSPRIRKEVLNRSMSNEAIVRTFDLCRRFGIRTHAFNMVGIPYETPEDVLQTIKLNALARADAMQVSIFYPYPGTKLFSVCQEEGWLGSAPSSQESYFEDVVFEQPSISREHTLFALRHFKLFASLYSALFATGRKAAEESLDRRFLSRSAVWDLVDPRGLLGEVVQGLTRLDARVRG